MTTRTKKNHAPAAADRADAGALKIMNALWGHAIADIEYHTRRDGSLERIPASATPVTDHEIKHLLAGNRVVDRLDALEQIGRPATDRMLRADQLRKDEKGWLWVTKAGAARFDLPEWVEVASGARCALVE